MIVPMWRFIVSSESFEVTGIGESRGDDMKVFPS
jgi:hypothetical protein